MQESITTIIVTVVATLSATGIAACLRFLYKHLKDRKNWHENKMRNLSRQLDSNHQRLNLIKSNFYIRPRGQERNPISVENNGPIESYDLINFFLKNLLDKENTERLRYLVLGGSGTGKSIFAVSLFVNYINKYKWKKAPFDIFVLYMGDSDVISKIKAIGDPDKTILILDALDENVNAIKEPKAFFNSLEEAVNDFRAVIITIRTQFYPDRAAVPQIGGIVQGGEVVRLNYNNIYISPFNDEEISRYLEEKYNIPSTEYSKALSLINKINKTAEINNVNKTAERPLILSYIDDLLSLGHARTIRSVTIYKLIIDKWLSREVAKCHQDGNNAITIERLYDFSKKIAARIYQKWAAGDGNSLTKEEYDSFKAAHGFDPDHDPYSYSAKSLIDRTDEGAIIFTHRAFWEFFIALNAFENPMERYSFIGLNLAQSFIKELDLMRLSGEQLPDGIDTTNFNNAIPLQTLLNDFTDTSADISEYIESGISDEEMARQLFIRGINLFHKGIEALYSSVLESGKTNDDFKPIPKAISLQILFNDSQTVIMNDIYSNNSLNSLKVVLNEFVSWYEDTNKKTNFFIFGNNLPICSLFPWTIEFGELINILNNNHFEIFSNQDSIPQTINLINFLINKKSCGCSITIQYATEDINKLIAIIKCCNNGIEFLKGPLSTISIKCQFHGKEFRYRYRIGPKNEATDQDIETYIRNFIR